MKIVVIIQGQILHFINVLFIGSNGIIGYKREKGKENKQRDDGKNLNTCNWFFQTNFVIY